VPDAGSDGQDGGRRGPTVLRNAGWLVGDRVVRLLLAVVGSAVLARVLGPAEFGVLQFALSAALLAQEASSLGLRGVLVRRLALEPQASGGSLRAAVLLRLASALVAAAAVLGLGLSARPDETDRGTVLLVLVLVSVALVARSGEVLFTWFEAQGRLRANSLTTSVSGALATLLRLGIAVVVPQPLTWIAATYVLEWGVASLVPALLLRRYPAAPRSRDPLPLARRCRLLLAESWPVALAGVATAVYLKVGQIILGATRSAGEVGQFAAAAQITEAATFVPMAVATAAFPAMLRLHGRDRDGYEDLTRRLLVLTTGLGWLYALAVAVVAPFAIPLLFGSAFEPSVLLLQLQVLAAPFIYQRAVLSRHLIVDGLLRFSLFTHGAGAVVAVAVDLALVPRYGAVGAVVGYVLATSVASTWVLLLHPRTRSFGGTMVRALGTSLLPPVLLASARSIRGLGASGAVDPADAQGDVPPGASDGRTAGVP